MQLNDMVDRYVQLRDRKAEMKAAFDASVQKIDLVLAKIEQKLMTHFQETGSESVRTEAGTAYKSVQTSASVADRDTYFNWVMEAPEERLGFLEARVAKRAVEEYVAETGGELPPGVNYSQRITINVRRSS